MKAPWGVHAISSLYKSGVSTQWRNDWVMAVAEPYPCTLLQRMRAAWWVLTSRAEALLWPEAGELEQAIAPKSYTPPKPSGYSSKKVIAGARVEVLVEVRHCGSWGDNCSVSQIHKQAAEEAVGYIQNRTQRDRRLRIIGNPRVISVSSEQD